MKPRPRILTYCSNIHPGESWADVQRNLASHTLAVKARLSPAADFPLGLRISSRAARELDADSLRAFRAWCEESGCFVATLNGFPYGTFAGRRVKDAVYTPDWRTPERVAYTTRLADILAAWLPAGLAGTISTVPVAFKSHFDAGDAALFATLRANVIATLEHLDRIRQRAGVRIALAFEPEPGCVLETTAEVIAFFERLKLPEPLRDLAVICFDCCHQAVEFEAPADCLRSLAAAGVQIGKVQVSSSLHAEGAQIEGLSRFDEPTWLHQVVARRRDGTLERFVDLPDFLAAPRQDFDAVRVHFHVPVFADDLGICGTTQGFLDEILPRLDPAIPLEVETYTFDVLPEPLRGGSVVDCIVRELEWTRERTRERTIERTKERTNATHRGD